ncbi:MAG: cysteine desulfurase NifS [Lachnospiraceae bacterium]|nr:cysteine desulfurase NifS [Lachnospiraceae bacterium]
MGKLIYMDNAATTFVDKRVLDAMTPYLTDRCFNPSSIYDGAQDVHADLDNARATIAKTLNASDREIYFTACGTESDNWAIKGVAHANADKGKHLITSKIEHHAVLHSMAALEKEGYDVTYLDVDENGFVSVDALDKAIRPDTVLVSIMYANNEIGTIEPIKEIAEVCHKHNVYFHVDAVQAYAHLPIDVKELGIDMLSASGHKFNAMKGTGFLYIKKGTKIQNFMDGGAQEFKKRAGTENVAGIIGMAKATEIAHSEMKERMEHETKIRDYMIDRILKEIPYSKLNGDRVKRLSNNLNIGFEFIEGESMLLALNDLGVCASSGSACTSGSLDPSHVLLAIGLPHEKAHGSLRLTVSHETTMDDAKLVCDNLPKIVERLRSMSPLYEDFVKKNK